MTADGFENLRALIDPKRRLATAKHPSRRPRFVPGRWALLRFAHAADERSDGPRVADVTADGDARGGGAAAAAAVGRRVPRSVARETITPPWRDLLITFRRMEAQGEIRGGRFVSGFVGEQFARPEAVELLREVRRDQNVGAAPHVSAADPLNLAGIITPGLPHQPALGPRRPAVGGIRRLTIKSGQTPFLRIS